MPYYKALASNGGSPFGVPAAFVGFLPAADAPGGWVEVEGDISLNPDARNAERGIFLCRDESDLLAWLAETIYEAEPDTALPFIQDHGYAVAKRVRLVRRLFADTWTDEAARVFAADCAEHVLHLFPAGAGRDELLAILSGARDRAAAGPEAPDTNDALEDLANRAHAIAGDIGQQSATAARVALAVAEATHGYKPGAEAARNAAKAARRAAGDLHDVERGWQVARLMATLQPPGDG